MWAGWFAGAVLGLIVVLAIPGDQGWWAFVIGASFSFVGSLIGDRL